MPSKAIGNKVKKVVWTGSEGWMGYGQSEKKEQEFPEDRTAWENPVTAKVLMLDGVEDASCLGSPMCSISLG